MMKNIVRIFSIGVAAIFATIFVVSYPSKSRALDTISQISGECGGVFSLVRKHYVPDDGKTVDVMLYINFDTKKISVSSTRANIPNGYNGLDKTKQVTYTTNNATTDGGFTLVNGPIPKSFKILPNSDTNIPQIIIMPVSAGNTMLLQAVDENAVGVCQKL